MAKNILVNAQVITNGDMSTASITSATVQTKLLSNIAVQCNSTGTPTGTYAVQVSNDQVNWFTKAMSPALSNPAGAGASTFGEFNQLAWPYMRITYTRSSGSGTLNIFVSGKDT